MRNAQMLRYVRTVVRVMAGSVLFFLCVSCNRENEILRGEELLEQIDQTIPWHVEKIDSLVRLSEGLLPVERYAVLNKGLGRLWYADSVYVKHYMKHLDSLPFPEVNSPAEGILLLRGYIAGGYDSKYDHRELHIESIASLLFDIENRWDLTPPERLSLLAVKSGIYAGVFREYKSTLLIAMDGLKLAREYGGNQKDINRLFQALGQSLIKLTEEGDEGVTEEELDDFIASAEMFPGSLNGQINSVVSLIYERRGDYHKAYDWLMKSGRDFSEHYYPTLTWLYVKMDSVQAALGNIERGRRVRYHPLMLAGIAWDEARIRQKMGDEAGYERCLHESIELSARKPIAMPIDLGRANEAYARILWQRGKRADAIRQMELLKDSFRKAVAGSISMASKALRLPRWLESSSLLRDYYIQEGRRTDAQIQSRLCDSLSQLMTDCHILNTREKAITSRYTMEMERNLKLREVEFRAERQKLYFTYFVLAVVLLAGVIFWLHYRQREMQLNVLYARQKELEQLQTEKQKLLMGKDEKLSPEEQLFRKLEQQFYKEELFRNPGFSRDDLCRLGGTNRMYVSTCINKYAGANINQWINKARIDYAIRLIGAGESDLGKISEQSGFSSIKSFFRSFKQFTNLTPRQYIIRDRQEG